MSYESHANGFDGSNNTTVSSSALAVAAGRTVAVLWATQEDGGQTQSVTDGAGATYSLLQTQGTLGAKCRLWVCHNHPGHAGNVVTVTSSGSHRYKYVDQIVLNPGGVGTTDDSDGAEAGGSTNAVTPSMSATGAGTILYVVTSTNDRSWTPGTDFNEISDYAAGMSTGYRDITGAGSYTASATASSSSNIAIAGVIVADAAGGGGADQPAIRRFGLVERSAQLQFGREGQRLMRLFDRQVAQAQMRRAA